MTKKRRKQSAFTLVELLVVIAILAVLISVVVIGYTQFIEEANKSRVKSEAHQVKTVLQGHMVLEDEVGGLKFDYYRNNDVPKLTYTGEGEPTDEAFKAAFPDLADLEGTFEFESTGDQITKITYKLEIKGKPYTSEIVIADLFLHQEETTEP